MVKVFRICLFALLAGIMAAVNAADSLYTEGQEYRVLSRTLPRSAADDSKVEVLEFFWYGCPHCFRLEPYLEKWVAESMPPNAEFVQVPATLNPSWQVHARAFYVAKTLGLLSKVHGPLMNAIHVDRNPMQDERALAEFFAEYGVSEADFEKAYRSFAVETGLRRAAFLVDRAGIRAVPSIVVAGKYETSVSMAGGTDELLQVINYLIEREAEEAS